MAKTKISKLHKIKIHHNRWLIWAIVYVLFVAIALLGYLKIVNLNFDLDSQDFSPSHSYSDSRMGFAVRYPGDWSIEAEGSSISFLPRKTSDEGVVVSTIALTSGKALRQTLKISKESVVSLDNIPAVKITNSIGGNHSETVIIVPFNQKLYVIRGDNKLVEKLLQTFHFTK